jgi:hypothetical protein
MALHHGDVDGAARRHQRAVLGDLTGPQDVRFLDSKNIVNDVQNYPEGWPDGLSFADCRVPMQDLPQHFRVRDQSPSGRDKAFQQNLSLTLMRMWRANEVHRDIRIDEDQAR